MTTATSTETSAKFLESKLIEASKQLHAVANTFADILDELDDSVDNETVAGIIGLRSKVIAAARATDRERVLAKHGTSAPKTAAISRGIN